MKRSSTRQLWRKASSRSEQLKWILGFLTRYEQLSVCTPVSFTSVPTRNDVIVVDNGSFQMKVGTAGVFVLPISMSKQLVGGTVPAVFRTTVGRPRHWQMNPHLVDLDEDAYFVGWETEQKHIVRDLIHSHPIRKVAHLESA